MSESFDSSATTRIAAVAEIGMSSDSGGVKAKSPSASLHGASPGDGKTSTPTGIAAVSGAALHSSMVAPSGSTCTVRHHWWL